MTADRRFGVVGRSDSNPVCSKVEMRLRKGYLKLALAEFDNEQRAVTSESNT